MTLGNTGAKRNLSTEVRKCTNISTYIRTYVNNIGLVPAFLRFEDNVTVEFYQKEITSTCNIILNILVISTAEEHLLPVVYMKFKTTSLLTVEGKYTFSEKIFSE